MERLLTACPKCGSSKDSRSELCRACWKDKPRARRSQNPRTGRQWARDHLPLEPNCERCGAEAVDRHHRDGNPLNNDPGNVASLCRRCHMELDGRLRWRLGRRETHCKHGHAFTDENTYVNPGTGRRRCRTCQRRIDRERGERLRAA